MEAGDADWRGCASAFAPLHLVDDVDRGYARHLTNLIYNYNCTGESLTDPPLDDIVYRSSVDDSDMLHPVYRWDFRHYTMVFGRGLPAREQTSPSNMYLNLDQFINVSGPPLRGRESFAYISCTQNFNWTRPARNIENFQYEIFSPGGIVAASTLGGRYQHPARNIEIFQYEIFSPGGIVAASTLGGRYQHPQQDEITFVQYISPQFIRSVRPYRVVRRTVHGVNGARTCWVRTPSGSQIYNLNCTVDEMRICNALACTEEHMPAYLPE